MRENENEERADRILDAAAKLIVHYGYDKTTVSDIAREAGVSKGAIYLHWKSKDDLLEALIFRESERLVEDMLIRVEADPEAGSIFSLYEHSMVSTLANPLIHAVMTQDVRILGDFTRRWVRENAGRAEESSLFHYEMVRQLQQANVIRTDLDAGMISYVMELISYGFLTIHEMVPPEKNPPVNEVGKVLGMILEKALAPEGGGNNEAGKQVLIHALEGMRELVRHFREKK